MKRRWFFFFLMRSISQRKGRMAIASLAITLAVAVITGMIGITLGISEKLGAELKSYGANIVVSARQDAYLKSDELDSIVSVKNVEEALGQVLGSAMIGHNTIEIIGLDIERIKNKGWRLIGDWPHKKSEIILGINLRNALTTDTGKTITLFNNENRSAEFVVAGFIEKSGSEDNAVIMSIPDAWGFLNLDGRFSAALVRAKPGKSEVVVNAIKNLIPDALVKTVRQVALAEESLLKKIQLLMLFVTIVVLFTASISVAGTMGANVLERRKEIGLMKAIGATKKGISLFYNAEAVLIGLLGGIFGFVVGYLTAQAVSKGAFHSFIPIPFYVFLISVLTGLIISALSSYFPVRDAMKYNPAVILRGE